MARWEGFDADLAAWCGSRLETVRGLPDSFYLDPTAHWALRSGVRGDAP